ncbi:MAG: Gfo/Idh/MocA family oxidoreductase, partial [Pirellulaceae bacterium]|nr:Gfo/Idh/MocA family oxidoreductase [Pirellulaceae bacterium]
MPQLTRRKMLQVAGSAWLASGALSSVNAQSPKSRIKVGQIGVQHAHATKLSVYRDSPDYEVVGVVERDEQAWAKAKELPAFRDLPWLSEEQLLSTPGLEVVLVETPVRDLLAAAGRAIDAGKHVHLDKPAGNDLPLYKNLLESARQKQLMVQMGYMYRYNPAVLLLRE